MKFLCLLLSVYVIMLSIKPCCSDHDCQDEAISKKEVAPHAPVKEKPCSGCSPFFTCGTCVGFILAKAFSLPVVTKEHSELKYAAYQHPFIQQVALSIWQPPQLG